MEPIRVQGRLICADDLAWLRALMAAHPHWHRTALSRYLCEVWNWRNAAGRPKDMAARTLLLKLARRGLLELPASRQRHTPGRRRALPRVPSEDERPGGAPAPIAGPLSALQPVGLELVVTPEQRRGVTRWLQRYHYRGYHGPVGENVQYLARDARGEALAVMVFGAAAWKVAARDHFIGWSVPQRSARLGLLANQQRFLIFPWVRVPHLASHLLRLAQRRLSADWQRRYGHPIWLIETFVDTQRFGGAAYRAAGWRSLGQTTGRTRQDRQRTLQTPLKTLWVQPLHPNFREPLTQP